jgi:hypothetical protein
MTNFSFSRGKSLGHEGTEAKDLEMYGKNKFLLILLILLTNIEPVVKSFW